MPFKNEEIRRGFERPHPTLNLVYYFVIALILGRFKKIAVMTSSARSHDETVALYLKMINPKTGEFYKPEEVRHSCHGTAPLRAFDLRSWMFTPGECQEIQRVINEHWTYDPDRPHKKVCLYHKVGNNAWHFHFQVCDATIMKLKN